MRQILLVILLLSAIGLYSPMAYGFSDPIKIHDQLNPNLQHIVRKGESISSILKKYQMPLKDFMEANPEVKASATVNLGQTLAIPRVSIGTSTSRLINREVKDFMAEFNQEHIEPKVVSAPTITRAAAPIQAQNPQLSSIAQPTTPQLQKLDPSTKKFDYHTVMPKETLYGLSKMYNVSIEDILKYNEDVREMGLKERSTIRIPRFGVSSSEVTVATQIPIEPTFENREFEVFDTESLDRAINISLLMPILGESDPREEGFKDIYRGLLLAVDSLKRCGISTKVELFGVGRGNDMVYSLVNEGKLNNSDIIIGPVFESQMQLVAPFALTANIPIVSPLLSMDIDNGTLIEISPEQSLKYDKADGFFDDKRIIYYKSDNDDQEFLSQLAKIGAQPDTTLLYDKFMTPDSMATILERGVENVFIVSAKDNLNIELLMSKMTALKATAYNHKLSVFGSSHLSNIPKEKRSDFFKVNTRYITSSFQDRTNEASLDFETAYFDMFGYAPTPFAYRGYEIGMLFLPEIAQNGRDFMENMNDVLKQVIQVPYLFYRENNYTKFVNQEWLLVNYRPNYSIIIN